MAGFVLAIHGGAGPITRANVDAKRQHRCQSALRQVLALGHALLAGGRPALDVVEEVVLLLEDCELFNAGRGSSLTADGTVEMGAAVMDGTSQRAGAVAGVTTVRNPVSAARAVLDAEAHVMLAGDGAERFARAHGLRTEDPAYFVTDDSRAHLERLQREGPDATGDGTSRLGTVGAVARDAEGRLAAATSSGGLTNQLSGRIGDSPLIGAGTWADAACAVSATGKGDAFIRAAFAHDVAAAVAHTERALDEACTAALHRVHALGGLGGCIAVDANGPAVILFTSAGMYRGLAPAKGPHEVGMFGDDAPGAHLEAGTDP